jgi:hypothetical protein
MASSEDKEKITPTEAITLVLDPLHKALDRTMLLKPSEFNSKAVDMLIECHTRIAQRIPGASDKIIPIAQVAQSSPPKISETTAYKNQIRQGQTIFAAPGEVLNSPEEVETNSNSFSK